MDHVGLVALEQGPAQLPRDHARAKALAQGMARLPGAVVDPALVETNIVFLRTRAGVRSYVPIVQGLRERGVLAFDIGALGIRFVTHREVDDDDVARALDALADLVPRLGAST